ncbi:aspartate aminotransferase family protein [Brenneria rubrifaciens]|uniref:Aspartate aminotransferase family protein n=1 Tax=Brenneria rubrifaciens TaxID=55213 RepID=A0A4P8QMR5_9GAMM|nr:aspartate aminotransferase family protein [Brenneria rubrifaciens]QCR08432.1 aspartate aminotransferase family protein [Brenneria rubrifaciens]
MTDSHLRRGKMVNAFDPDNLAHLDAAARAAVERRIRLLGPAYRLFYQQPVEVNRAQGVRLYDRNGNVYLDAYNNVVSVGHAHPKIADAVNSQMRRLCTHTRYLQDGILDYAEQLLPTFGGRIAEQGHMMFTCTGSEANDLALRIARHYTGRQGVIITSEAYHGNSFLTAGISPSLGGHSPLGEWVCRVPAPDSYRFASAEMGQRMARQVAEQIDELQRRGQGLAAFIADSVFSSDGIYADPTDLLAPVAEVVRAAGGLFIADEVQSGFARTGDALWGFQRHGVDPDIITLGKPMGNGYPVAAVAVTHEAVARFGRDQRYFNTFGGNSVAIAAAQATFDVIREERLQENAHRIGAFIRAGLHDIARRYPQIGDIRGAGLYIGVEMVSDPQEKVPDAALATAIVNGLRERQVLISATGFSANILKIRPPLVFSENDAGQLLTELEAVLAQWVSRGSAR